MKCSIVIINFNTKSLTEQTIQSILDGTQFDFEIIIVDNSTNESERFYSHENDHVNILHCENHGFGHACNRGVDIAKGEYVLLLNSDTIVEPGSIDKCLEYIEQHKDIGALGCKLVLEDGSLDHGCRRGFPTPINSLFYFAGLDRLFPNSALFGGYRLNYLSTDDIHDVDAISGAFMMMRHSLYTQINGFDEAFFMYGEDLDLCYRIKEQGLRIVYFPCATVKHLKGQSGLNTSSNQVIFHFYDAMLIFYRKHYKEKYGLLMYALISFAVKLKYRLTLIGKRHG